MMTERFNLQQRIKPLCRGRRLPKDLGFSLNTDFHQRLSPEKISNTKTCISTQTWAIETETKDMDAQTDDKGTRDVGTSCKWNDFVNMLSFSEIGDLILQLQTREKELLRTKKNALKPVQELEFLVKKTHHDLIINGLIKMD